MYTVITGPASEPITLTEAKTHLRVDGTDSDTIITSLIKQAREYAEDYQNKKYITQTLELVLDKFPDDDYIEFVNTTPVQSITSVKYFDTDGTDYTFDSANYALDTDSFVNKLHLKYQKLWPTTILQPYNGVRIRFICGYGEASAVPETFKQAMLIHIQLLYDINRYTESDIKRMESVRDRLLGMRRVIPI
jgi:uncharacterized phiE125 gp8 family phage protein